MPTAAELRVTAATSRRRDDRRVRVTADMGGRLSVRAGMPNPPKRVVAATPSPPDRGSDGDGWRPPRAGRTRLASLSLPWPRVTGTTSGDRTSMTTESTPRERIKITYATLSNDNEDLHRAYEEGLERAKARLGRTHRNWIDGRERDGEGTFELRSPIDNEIVVGTFSSATAQDARDAIAAARRAQPEWAALGWERRLEIVGRAAELISERQMEYGGLMAIEVGKNRLGGVGQVEGAAELIPP